MRTMLLSNPHSSSSSRPNLSQQVIDSARRRVLQLFKASENHFDIIFVANATAGIKLVAEAFAGNHDGFEYLYHRDSHTSLVGVRELATRSNCIASDSEVETWIQNGHYGYKDQHTKCLRLFAYPAQSNMNGRRLPLSWSSAFRSSSPFSTEPHTYTLLDAAAYVSTTALDLSNPAIAPDFTVLSFYKTYGFPNLGALIVRKDSAYAFHSRKYFGGGTTEMTTCSSMAWVARKPALYEKLEDGTAATHSILALSCAIDIHKGLFGELIKISTHTGWLAKCLYEGLKELRHQNGVFVCRIYKDAASIYGDTRTQGATVAFNVCQSDGTWVGSSMVGRLAMERNIHVRTGSLCNPAGMAQALNLTDEQIQRAYYSGFRCGQKDDIRDGVPMGMVRVSFGAMSTLTDVDVFIEFIRQCFVEGRQGVKTTFENDGNAKDRAGSLEYWKIESENGKRQSEDERMERKVRNIGKLLSLFRYLRRRFSSRLPSRH